MAGLFAGRDVAESHRDPVAHFSRKKTHEGGGRARGSEETKRLPTPLMRYVPYCSKPPLITTKLNTQVLPDTGRKHRCFRRPGILAIRG